MTNGKSRAKGVRGERTIVRKLGGSAKRTGQAFQPTVDVTTEFAAYSIKNRTIGGAAILSELRRLEALEPGRNHYVVFKPGRGIWVVAEFVTQHVADHGDDELRYGTPESEMRDGTRHG